MSLPLVTPSRGVGYLLLRHSASTHISNASYLIMPPGAEVNGEASATNDVVVSCASVIHQRDCHYVCVLDVE